VLRAVSFRERARRHAYTERKRLATFPEGPGGNEESLNTGCIGRLSIGTGRPDNVEYINSYPGYRRELYGHGSSPCDQERQEQRQRNRMWETVQQYVEGRRDQHRHGRASIIGKKRRGRSKISLNVNPTA